MFSHEKMCPFPLLCAHCCGHHSNRVYQFATTSSGRANTAPDHKCDCSFDPYTCNRTPGFHTNNPGHFNDSGCACIR
jgi:hypothetical protein